MKLTAKSISTLKLPAGKTDHLEWDDEIPGLGLRLRAGGSRNWVFQYALGDKQRRLSLGAATPESFTKHKGPDGTIKLGIRDQAAQLHAKVKLGEDGPARKLKTGSAPATLSSQSPRSISRRRRPPPARAPTGRPSATS